MKLLKALAVKGFIRIKKSPARLWAAGLVIKDGLVSTILTQY